MALIELGNPELLLLTPLFVTLTLIGHYFAHRAKRSLEVFHYPSVQRLSRIVTRKGVRRSPWRGVSLVLKLIIIVVITLSLSNPSLLLLNETSQKVQVPMVNEKDVAGQIILAVDVSGSMGIKDLSPSRLEAAKKNIVEFIQNSTENVRYGVVAFERQIVKSSALSGNKNETASIIGNLTAAAVLPCLEEFTDIGIGLQTSLDFLAVHASSNRTSAIILVSDGFANFGYPSPFQSVFNATNRAKNIGVPIYALFTSRLGQDSNDELLRQIATETHGKFMESTNSEDLREMLNVIGKYFVPTHEWSSTIEVKTTIPVKTGLGLVFMLVATAFIVTLWIGNYRHYKTSF